jgi:hypothetical protein
MSPGTFSSIIQLSAKNTRKKEEGPGAKKNAQEALSSLYEPAFSVWAH